MFRTTKVMGETGDGIHTVEGRMEERPPPGESVAGEEGPPGSVPPIARPSCGGESRNGPSITLFEASRGKAERLASFRA